MSTVAIDKLALPSAAVQVLPAGASRLIWLAERRNSIGGSDCSTLVGLNPYGSLMQLWLDKTGQLPELRINTAIEWGNLLEPVVRDWFAATYRKTVVPVGMLRRPDLPRCHANLDGVVLDEQGQPAAALEIKTTSWRMAHEWADGQVPDHAELQAQHNMWISGLPRCYVVGLIDGRDPQVRLVHADADLGAMLAGEANRFYADYIDPMIAPPLDDSKATNAAVRATLGHPLEGKAVALTDELLEAFRAHAAAGARRRAAEADERYTDAELRTLLGDAAVIVDDPDKEADVDPDDGGRVVYATAINNGTFSSKRFLEEEPELAEEFTVDQPALDVPALKAKRQQEYRRYCARTIRTRKTLTQLLERTAAAIPTNERP